MSNISSKQLTAKHTFTITTNTTSLHRSRLPYNKITTETCSDCQCQLADATKVHVQGHTHGHADAVSQLGCYKIRGLGTDKFRGAGVSQLTDSGNVVVSLKAVCRITKELPSVVVDEEAKDEVKDETT